MHYGNLVIAPKEEGKTLTQLVEPILAEGYEDWWDFWQVGGRWTGLLDGYDPDTDPLNQEQCNLCDGTGKRPESPNWDPRSDWAKKCNGCNGCQGKGAHVTWPTQWGERLGDSIPIEQLTDEHISKAYRIVLPDSRRIEAESWCWRDTPWKDKPYESENKELEMPPASWLKTTYPNHLVIVVDNHD